ncbi:MAG: 16S rRNA (cytosine(967)-C(5))-methyltransferase [Cyanobacteria bacterium QS_8_64_29]|nr:MAG: 16S rRNA (cytosine(967)-C(5))-methyltransferase [Cyanobacteria bacterium QS_8_64_29]
MAAARQAALAALRQFYRQGAYADVALDRALSRQAEQDGPMPRADSGFAAELTYGTIRRKRTLDALIDCLGRKPAHQQPLALRMVLQLGLYQLRYLPHIPEAAAVHTSVELAKANRLRRLASVVNGMLRQYARQAASGTDPLPLPSDPTQRLGIAYSLPDWIVATWQQQLDAAETERLCAWCNQPPVVDLRINPLQTSRDHALAAVAAGLPAGSNCEYVSALPQALRLQGGAGSLQALPGYREGWWSVQDSSAQLVGHLLAPQPGEMVVDACAAPGGKSTHIAELMGDCGTVWACDHDPRRLQKVRQNAQRLRLQAVRTQAGDVRALSQFQTSADRVLLDAPCSGLGTLHRRPDLRWRQTPARAAELAALQRELLAHAAAWVKPGGVLVYATCTLNSSENGEVVRAFLQAHPEWRIQPPSAHSPAAPFADPWGPIAIWPTRHQMDGFFMVRLQRASPPS